jgi:hypothetical protein
MLDFFPSKLLLHSNKRAAGAKTNAKAKSNLKSRKQTKSNSVDNNTFYEFPLKFLISLILLRY